MNTNTYFPSVDHRSTDGLECCHRFAMASTNLGNEFSSTDIHDVVFFSSSNGTSSNNDEVVVEGGGGGGCDQTVVESDYFDGVFKYIQQMLLEEEDDLESRPCMFQDCIALQAAEKSFYDALTDNNNNDDDPTIVEHCSSTDFPVNHGFISTTHCLQDDNFNHFLDQSDLISDFDCSNTGIRGNTPLNNNCQVVAAANDDHRNIYYGVNSTNTNNQGGTSKSEGKKKHNREDCGESSNGPNSKQFASNGAEETEEKTHEEYYDKAVLCPDMNPAFYVEDSCDDGSRSSSENAAWDKQKSRHIKQSKRGRPRGTKKGVKTNEVVDLTSLLTRCAEAAASYNSKTFVEVLSKIRQHSSPFGDPTARLAYCFANALEARFAGGGGVDTITTPKKSILSAADFLKAYQVYITACPFKRMSNIFANKSIAKLTSEAPKVHIIDFGILYGFQWPCIIHGISLRPGGPPKLKITGIDFPQPGFRPAERVEETGRRLENYCKRFGVPFEYKAIAKKWDDIKLEHLNIEQDETVVVNCLYRLKNVPDETVLTNGNNNPRNAVLRLIKEINPHWFVHGIVNAMYNASFFTTRFREALFHFSSQFDMFEATMTREDEGRMIFEQEVFGRDIMNVIACEGTERVERPESYKQWSVRNQIAGFRQLPLNQDIVKEVKAKVRMFYHRDFLVDEDSNWMLQGWKGRIMYALSVWQPIHK
uniref:Scarecrow-like protein 30 n=1 Tax=Nicotiana tabacum TaxID=4097 RepID=A0A1S4D6M8_TOBAC|nr:PREDICTED: scarecrow-like protein 30 [Nicotiana tabacum]